MKLLLSAVFALGTGQTGPHRQYNIGNGYLVTVTQGSDDPNYGEYYGSSINIRGQSTRVNLQTRSLIDDWLKSDDIWGSHETANQMRYLDSPDPNKKGLLQGKVLEVVPASDGCLIRIGVVCVSPSSPRINRDVIVRWRTSAPKEWPAIFEMDDENMPDRPTVRLPRFNGVQYLLDEKALYRLDGDYSKQTLVAKLPPAPPDSDKWYGERYWFGLKQVGPNLIITLPFFDIKDYDFRNLNLLTGAISHPTKRG
jgi:hypothetical protein